MSFDVIADGARLAALRELGLLDAEPDPDLERLTSLATELLEVPVALVSLVDRDRQFFAGAHGLDGEWAAARETPLSHSLCKYTVASGEPLVISDAHRDARVADTLAVRDMSIGAYAGIPLVLSDGQAVGTFCAIDHEPHEWSQRDLRILGELADAVRSLLEMRRALARRSLQDSLTGLPNRTLTLARAEQITSAHPDRDLAAVAVSIDGLRTVNDAYGTEHGDRLIVAVARRLGEALDEGDVLGRVAGDTFLFVRAGDADEAAALALAHRLHELIADSPVQVRGDRVAPDPTVALVTGGPGTDGAELVRRAIDTLRRVRERLHEAGDASDQGGAVDRAGPRAQLRRRLLGPLPGAVRRGEIVVEFQPIVELSTGDTHGYEALARWRHPELGKVSPGDFIPLAEATGDIVLIGEHVLRTACTQLALWRRLVAPDDLTVTVNVSPVQLAVPNLSDVVDSILREAGLPGSALTLEITEGVFIAPGAAQRRNLEAIRQLGVRLALDDFGTGYSTLSYLKRFPVDLIKIDRCFMDGLETDERDAALMHAILQIGSRMELDVVAEGVETRAQRDLLRLSGCRLGQGYLFSRPLPADEVAVRRDGARERARRPGLSSPAARPPVSPPVAAR